jgi:hypothetical protein
MALFVGLLGVVGALALQPDTVRPTYLPGALVATGYVYHDANRNGVREPGERGIGGVRVSDQRSFAKSDSRGRWSLELHSAEDVTIFVVKPRGWMTPVDQHMLPKFYYTHKPNGSPKTRYPGVEPTGPLPVSVDFPLYPQREPSTFRALFFGDTQPRNVREVEYIQHDIVEPLIGKTDAKFGVTLGDIVFDDLDVFDPLVKTVALIGLPWYNVLGNHDINYDSPDDEHSDETFERWFGPNYYSFEYGPVHFVALDNVFWRINPENNRGAYRGSFGVEQLRWLKTDLEQVPLGQLVVLTMHIPLTDCDDRQELYRIIEDRPYVLSVSAHTHYQEHRFIKTREGWRGLKPHYHVVNVTACGSWWQGAPDENGIPHTTMRCGAPNGYAIFTFDGSQYDIQFRAARRHESYQMSIYAPDKLSRAEAPGTEVLVNVFGGSELSRVEMSFANGPWTPMRKVLKPDPEFVKMYERDREVKAPYRALPAPMDSPHLWSGVIPENPPSGMAPIHVRTTDMFGQTYVATRGVLIQ